MSPAKVALGKKLFFEKFLSADGSISCSTCHQPERAFADGRPLAQGIDQHRGTRNAPTLFNAAFNTTQFWDGRRSSLEQQALDPLVNPREHGLKDYAQALDFLRRSPTYVDLFRQAFSIESREIELRHVAQAIACFERTLVAGDSPFDRYEYGGDSSALSESARRGLALFKGAGRCATCHTIDRHYALFTDNAFHSVNIGLQRIAPHLAELTTRLVNAKQSGANIDQTILSEDDLAELGRFAVTLKPADIGKFRTPSLRNVALTAPYMHDGSVATLREAVDIELYNRGTDAGRPLILRPQDKTDLVEFLQSLMSAMAGSTLEQRTPQDIQYLSQNPGASGQAATTQP
jgi:cytochrome c peroxidase